MQRSECIFAASAQTAWQGSAFQWNEAPDAEDDLVWARKAMQLALHHPDNADERLKHYVGIYDSVKRRRERDPVWAAKEDKRRVKWTREYRARQREERLASSSVAP